MCPSSKEVRSEDNQNRDPRDLGVQQGTRSGGTIRDGGGNMGEDRRSCQHQKWPSSTASVHVPAWSLGCPFHARFAAASILNFITLNISSVNQSSDPRTFVKESGDLYYQKKILLKHSWFTILCLFLWQSKVIKSHPIYTNYLILFHYVSSQDIDIVTCAMAGLYCLSIRYIIVLHPLIPSFQSHPPPPLLGTHKSVHHVCESVS